MNNRIASVFDQIEIRPERSEEIRSTLLASYASKSTSRKIHTVRKRTLFLAAILTVFLLLSGFASIKYVITPAGFVVGQIDENGNATEGDYVHEAGRETPPAHVEDGRIIFTLDGSNQDITDFCSETDYYKYETTDKDGFKYVIVVGGTPKNMGWGEFIWDPVGESWGSRGIVPLDCGPWMHNAEAELWAKPKE